MSAKQALPYLPNPEVVVTPEALVATFVGKHTSHFKVCINSTSKSLQGASNQVGKAINQY